MSSWGPIKSSRLGHTLRKGARARLAIGFASGTALLVLIGGTFPSLAPSNRAIAAGTPHTSAPPRIPASVKPTSAATTAPQDESSRRFTGLVGTDLSKALLAAGVPVEQGREYVALLTRAIPLNDALTVDDRFDLVLMREPDGRLGQLVYAGLDRIARADV
jgi:hypothetical protein